MDPAAFFRYCPRCGRAAEAATGARAFRCGACDFLYYFNAAVSVSAIIVDAADERSLFIRRAHEPAQGRLAFVGGFVDPGEAVEMALAREVREEVGLELVDVRWLASFPNAYTYREVVYPVADLFFVCRAANPAQATALDGVASLCWLDPRQVDPEDIAFPSMRAALAMWLRTAASW
jgi:NAD+ diphosphatase